MTKAAGVTQLGICSGGAQDPPVGRLPADTIGITPMKRASMNDNFIILGVQLTWSMDDWLPTGHMKPTCDEGHTRQNTAMFPLAKTETDPVEDSSSDMRDSRPLLSEMTPLLIFNFTSSLDFSWSFNSMTTASVSPSFPTLNVTFRSLDFAESMTLLGIFLDIDQTPP